MKATWVEKAGKGSLGATQMRYIWSHCVQQQSPECLVGDAAAVFGNPDEAAGSTLSPVVAVNSI